MNFFIVFFKCYVKRWRMFVIEAEFELLVKQGGCMGVCVCSLFPI